MDKCPYCGAKTRPSAKFCLNCGNRLVPTSFSVQPHSDIDGETQLSPEGIEHPARFVLRADDGAILQEFLLDKPKISIGRTPNSDILLSKDKLTSRLHATVLYENGRYVLRDERSANGTFVNGQQIEEMAPRVLQDGDQVGIGEYELLFHTYSSTSNSVSVENLPTIAVSPARGMTYGTREDAIRGQFAPEPGAPVANSLPLPQQGWGTAPQPAWDTSDQRDSNFDGTQMATSEPEAGLGGEEPSQKVLSRYSDVSFPESIIVSQEEALRVAITRKALNPWAAMLQLELPEDKAQLIEVDVCLAVSPLDFQVRGPNVRTIIVPRDADSLPIIFKLTAKSAGKKSVGIEFFQNSRYLGRVEILTTAMQHVQAMQTIAVPVETQITLELGTTISPPDLTILFDRVPVSDDKHYYRYRLHSPLRELNLWFDEFRSPETNVTPQGILEDTFKQLNNLISNTNPEGFFFGRLNSIGMSLYRRLFPDDFKHLYWSKLRDHVKNIVIISFEPWIPWELIRPFNVDTNEVEDGFLCEKFNLTRWLAGAGFPDTLSLEQLGLIVSASSLDAAKLESTEIRRILGAKVRDISSSSDAVYQLLRSSELSCLHFACHGSFNRDNPDMSTLKLEDGTGISPIDIDGDGLIFGKNKPLVFLNACETGQSGYALTGMGGWAEAFIGRAKCSGFIGSIWKAND